jgi:hypothetical protein
MYNLQVHSGGNWCTANDNGPVEAKMCRMNIINDKWLFIIDGANFGVNIACGTGMLLQ